MNKITYLPYIISNNTITITYEHNPYYILKVIDGNDNKQYDLVKKLIKEGNFDEIIDVIIPKKKVIKYIGEYFFITSDNKIFMRDDIKTEIPSILSDRILAFYEEGFPIEPIVNFWKLLRNNPSETSRQSLYRFLDANKHTITSKGFIIGYKSVNFDRKDDYTRNFISEIGTYNINISNIPKDKSDKLKLTDVYSKTFDNSIGTTVKIERKNVDSDIEKTCSYGLHVASYEYAKKHYNGDVVVEVLINPEYVVAVPKDYNNQKMRVCEYTVINYVPDINNEKLLQGKYDTYRDI